MNKKEIENLIRFVSKAGVSEVSIETKDFKISIKTNQKEQVVAHLAPVISQAIPTLVAVSSQTAANNIATPKTEAPPLTNKDNEANYHTIKSPMIGTFYRSSAPDKPNFVNVGDEIKEGQAICIIEAMKLFNEIESEVSGRIVKVLVDNATPVEYDQPLFLVEPI